MLTEADFDAAYGPLLSKWEARLGKDQVKELTGDLSVAVQELLAKTTTHLQAAGATSAHTDIIQHGIATYEGWRTKHGV